MTASYPPVDGTQPCALDPEAWYPEKGGQTSTAKAMCQGCEFLRPCLAWSLENDEWGVWGGTTRDQRRDLRRRFGIAARPAPHLSETRSAAARAPHQSDVGGRDEVAS